MQHFKEKQLHCLKYADKLITGLIQKETQQVLVWKVRAVLKDYSGKLRKELRQKRRKTGRHSSRAGYCPYPNKARPYLCAQRHLPDLTCTVLMNHFIRQCWKSSYSPGFLHVRPAEIYLAQLRDRTQKYLQYIISVNWLGNLGLNYLWISAEGKLLYRYQMWSWSQEDVAIVFGFLARA